MGFDIYGNRLLPGHCEVHPYVHEEFPCSICMAERSTQARQPDGPLCGICGKFEACADSCGVPVCSEACDHEAQRRHNEVETLRAELAALRAERAITASPWRYKEWGGLVVGGGEGSAEVLICTMATNTRHEEGRRNRELIVEAPTMRARLDKAEAEAARLRADAERYRWLKANHLQTGADSWIRTGEDLEEAIDAARAGGGQ